MGVSAAVLGNAIALLIAPTDVRIGVLESPKEKTKMLFHSRVTKSVKEVVGPRDYVGMPRRITIGRSTM